MFKIVINSEVMAVSGAMELAIRALPDLICDYANIENSNLINWVNGGIIVNSQCNSARASVKVTDIDIDIFIGKINVV